MSNNSPPSHTGQNDRVVVVYWMGDAGQLNTAVW
jgi:hypothetical protein